MQDPDSTRRSTARLMTYLSWIALLVVLSIFFNQYTNKRDNPNHQLLMSSPGQASEVVLRRSRSGHYTAPGLINGEPVVFLLDTGATTVSIPETVAQRIGLQRGAPGRVNTANGVITVYQTQLQSVSLGGIEQQGVRAHINPHMPSEIVLLGMSFMQHLEMVQSGDTLTLRIP